MEEAEASLALVVPRVVLEAWALAPQAPRQVPQEVEASKEEDLPWEVRSSEGPEKMAPVPAWRAQRFALESQEQRPTGKLQ